MRLELALDHVQVGAAHAAGAHAQQHLALCGRRLGKLGEFQRSFVDRPWPTQ